MKVNPFNPTKIKAKGFHESDVADTQIYISDQVRFGKWLTGSPVYIDDKVYIFPECSMQELNAVANIDIWLADFEVIPETICRMTEFTTFDQNDSEFLSEKIADRDLITFMWRNEIRYQVLMWYMEEGSEFSAVLWNKEDAADQNFLGYPVNYINRLSWDSFVLMISNAYGDFTAVKIIGNAFENPEILDWIE